MFAALIESPPLRLAFSKDFERLQCQVSDISASVEPCQLRCQLQNLVHVLNGMRYHFAGENTLCTFYRVQEQIIVDVQFPNQGANRIPIAIEDYKALLRQLGAEI